MYHLSIEQKGPIEIQMGPIAFVIKRKLEAFRALHQHSRGKNKWKTKGKIKILTGGQRVHQVTLG